MFRINSIRVTFNESEAGSLQLHIKKAENIVTEEHKHYLNSIRDKIEPNKPIEFDQEEKDLLIGLLKIFILDIDKNHTTYKTLDIVIKKLILS